MNDPCEHLPPGQRAICDGTSGHAPEVRAAYLRRWAEKGRIGADALNTLGVSAGRAARRGPDNEPGNPYGPTERDRPCWARWGVLREQTCDACGSRGVVKAIHFCVFHGECFEGLGGFRAPAAIQPCRTCDDYEPGED